MKKKPKIALLYDFDKTLSTTDMQNYTFIPALNIHPSEFWEECNRFSRLHHMDSLLVYMYKMIELSKQKHLPINREAFVSMGKDIRFFPGVESWFPRIDDFGESLGVHIEHYIISSGNREIIEGSSIYKYFKKVFACEFLYVNDEAVWPKSVINYTTKTQFLFRVNKGVLDISEDEKVNASTPDEERVIPFRNMIYIADGLTDVPCMKLIRQKGGYAIAVYAPAKMPQAKQLFSDHRVDYIAEADYRDKSGLDKIVRLIIRRMAVEDELVRLHNRQAKKVEEE